jgi:large subunit ribosomal protein L24e
MNCSLCKSAIPRGFGTMYVQNDGKIFYFCSSKCRINWKMKRSAVWHKKTKKTEAKK